ncbi:mmge/prpd family protein [Alicycliphilus sp. B1]|nr:mmge/prpd family protein [Alicycliphilus sp. B1]
MTNDELAAKFRAFVDGLLPAATIEQVIDSVLNLERVEDFGAVMRLMVRTSA